MTGTIGGVTRGTCANALWGKLVVRRVPERVTAGERPRSTDYAANCG